MAYLSVFTSQVISLRAAAMRLPAAETATVARRDIGGMVYVGTDAARMAAIWVLPKTFNNWLEFESSFLRA